MFVQIIVVTNHSVRYPEMQPLEYKASPIFPRTNPTDPIYLDYNATTPVDPEVAKAMWPFMTQYFGNLSSSHVYGKRGREE